MDKVLKKCPFCGGEASKSYYGGLRFIICKECGSRSKSVDVQDYPHLNNNEIYNLVIQYWNLRTP